MMRMDNMSTQRARLFEEIGKISFAIYELRLYLDTHPKCTEALGMIKEYMKKRHELLL